MGGFFLEKSREAHFSSMVQGYPSHLTVIEQIQALKHLSAKHTGPIRHLTPPAIIFNFTQPRIIEPILEDTVLKNNTHNN